ncbi:MAG: hypothetical protein ABH865_06055 [Candidatus Omnitrophota bacterium]|nr:hypothetical protein [Candidatus Omnitrophota bacterium]
MVLKNKILIGIGVVLVSAVMLSGVVAQDWREHSTDHFIVFYTGSEKFAVNVAERAEFFYKKIATDLGYPRYSEFWTWDRRVKIYIHPTRDSFQKATGQPSWSEGMADYKNKQIVSYAWSKGFTESLLPHEIAHLIFRDFVGFRGEIPLWLDEGVAQWAEEAKRAELKALARKLYDNDAILSLVDMMRIDLKNLKEVDKVYIRSTRLKTGEPGILFISGDQLVSTYYLQAVSLVGFLIERYGSASFADFCRQLRDGKSLEEALRFAYPTHIRNLQDFELEWRKYLEKGE